METAYLLLTKDMTVPGANPEPFGVAVSEKDEAKKFCRQFKERPQTAHPMYEPIILDGNGVWKSRLGWWEFPEKELVIFDTLDAALVKADK